MMGQDPSHASVRFDRVADRYDRTRALSADTMREIVRILGAELVPRPPALEIGVGTGRIALPLVDAGMRAVGVDLSAPMLARLVENAGGSRPFPLVVADATALPLRDGAFGSALAVHVLHLIPMWQRAVEELIRVVRPGGVIVADLGGWGSDWLCELQDRFCLEAGRPAPYPGVERVRELDAAMAARGAAVRVLEPVTVMETTSIGEQLERVADGLYSYTWPVPEDRRREIVATLRPEFEERFGALDEPRVHERVIDPRAYDLPS